MIVFTGDINLTDNYFDSGFGLGSMLAQGFRPFSHIEKGEGEYWVGNFEGVASDVTEKSGTDARHFRISPQHLHDISLIDVWGFANNHAMQHGGEAYHQTVATLVKNGRKVFGMKNRHSTVLEHQGKRISITGFSQRIDSWSDYPEYWHNPEYNCILEEIKTLPKDAFKVVYVHWGNEFINYPSSQQKRFAHWLIDVGFDLVVGMHPHVLQGFEKYCGKYIYYSLGNFVFDMAWEATHYGAVVTLDLSQRDAVVAYRYVRIDKDFSPSIVEEAKVPLEYRFEELNKLISKEDNTEEYHAILNKYYNQYRKANHRDIIKKMIAHPKSAIGTVLDFIKRRF